MSALFVFRSGKERSMGLDDRNEIIQQNGHDVVGRQPQVGRGTR